MKKESIEMLQDSLDLLTIKYTELIGKGSYNEAFNVMKNVDLVSRELEYLGEKIIVTDESIKNDWYDVLKFFIKTKQSQLIELDYSSQDNQMKHRGTGKTTALLRIANDYDIPILVKSYDREHKDLGKLACELGVKIRVIDLKMLNLPQYINCDVLLVDEMTKFDFINDVLRGDENKLNSKILIGFKTNL